MKRLALSALLLMPLAAAAETQPDIPMKCAPFKELVAFLHDQFREDPVGEGLNAASNVLFMLFASEGGKTWTMLAVPTSGKACPVSVGRDWTAAAAGKPL